MNGRIVFLGGRLAGWRELSAIERHTFWAAVRPDITFEPRTPGVVVETHVFEHKDEPFGPSVVRVLAPEGLFWAYETDVLQGKENAR